MIETSRIAFCLALSMWICGCSVGHVPPSTVTVTSGGAINVKPTPVNRPRLYPRFHDLPDPALVGQARVLKLAFADSDKLIDVPESVNTELRSHWVALENYHRAKAEGANIAQAIYEHSIAAANLSNTLESARIETSFGMTSLDKSESDDVVDTQVMLFVEFRKRVKNP